MSYNFINIAWKQEYTRVATAVMIDRRNDEFNRGAHGTVIKEKIDLLVNGIKTSDIFYKIENENGNLGGFFTLSVNTTNKTATNDILKLRTAYEDNETQINSQISQFIQSNGWREDYLFSD